MHAELKVQGGKLVVADVTATGNEISEARISGDFFLEPDAALDSINAALLGAPVGGTTEELTGRIEQRLEADFGGGVIMHGFAASDVATVVRRALTEAMDWTDFDWQVIHGPVLATPINVALDQVLTERLGSGLRQPTLRIWEWDDRAVVIGSFQSYRNEVSEAGVAKHGITVVRRISGGGAMFMEGGNCITYSLYVPDRLVAGFSYTDSYAYLDQWVIDELGKHGIQAWYKPINDITSRDGKIGGAAQKRFGNGAMLHHVTMSYDIDADKMVEVLRIGQAKISDKGITSAKKRVDPLRRQTGASRAEIITGMIDSFTARTGASRGAITEDELAAAADLVETKFGTDEWTRRIP